jgi:flavin reductase (DIM6/NTAB) family NADH-FMN oxidoreductase RutF
MAAVLASHSPLESLQHNFKLAMRGFAGAVSVVTVADGADRSGFTATSVSSFSATPPMIVASTRDTSSSAQLLRRTRRFGVNLLREEQQDVAQRFTGFGGERGAARYGSNQWTQLTPHGAPLLADSVVAMDCQVDELLERHGQILIIGRVCALLLADRMPQPLLYWQGRYTRLARPHALPN